MKLVSTVPTSLILAWTDPHRQLISPLMAGIRGPRQSRALSATIVRYMEATSNLDGAEGGSDLEEMRAVSDTDFGGPPPGTDSEGFLSGDGGCNTRYDDEDDEMEDARDGAHNPRYDNEDDNTKEEKDAPRATRPTRVDAGSLSGHESDLYAPSRSASPMHIDQSKSEVESDAGDMSPDEAALLEKLAAIRKAKKSKKSTPKSVAGSTKKKQDKAALRREIITERANPPPPHVAAPEAQRAKSGTTASKSGSKRKDIEGEGREEAAVCLLQVADRC
ncbi:hypothetical protein BDZ89DRAFT_1071616 [Hymenopellis radicata]|nr:hypothetical protein BDZ89DRAFT_1071616 [Hymenopellis radicata]